MKQMHQEVAKNQVRQPVSCSEGCAWAFLGSVVLLGIMCLCLCVVPSFLPKAPEKPKVIASSLPPEKLKELRVEYGRSIQPQVARRQREVERLLQRYREIVGDGEKTGDMVATYYNLGILEKDALEFDSEIMVPKYFPDDVKDLIEEAAMDYQNSATAIHLACRELRKLIDEGRFSSAERAINYTRTAAQSKASGDIKIVFAKQKLGFK